MAREVAIKINVGGTEKAVKSIDDLETAVEQLRNELKGVDIGSKQFKQLSGELQNAEGKLKTLNKSFEGLEPQQKTEAFVKLGEGVAGAFAIGTAALTAFGVESEDVAKAQVAVQTAIAASIGARQLAEAGLQAQVIATTISQKAYNLAATAGNTITKAFYTTIAANPIGAIITAVAALGVGIYALVQAMKTQITAQDEINKSLEESKKATIEQEVRLTSLNKIIQDTTKSDKERLGALNELKKELPSLEGLELDREGALNKVNTAVEKNIKLIQERAKAEALAALVSEKTKEIIEIQNSSIDDNLSLFEEAVNFYTGAFSPAGKQVNDILDAQANKDEKLSKAKRDLDQITKTYVDTLGNLFDAEDDVNDENDRARTNAEKREKAAKTANELKAQQIKLLREELALSAALVDVETGDLGEPAYLTEISEAIEAYQAAVDQAFGVDVFDEYKDTFSRLGNDVKRQLKNDLQDIGRIMGQLRPSGMEELPSDVFDETLMFSFGKGLENDIMEAEKLLDNMLNRFAKRLKEGDISQDQFDFFQSFYNNYTSLVSEIKKEPILFDNTETEKNLLDLDKLLLEFLGSTDKVFNNAAKTFGASSRPASPAYLLQEELNLTAEETKELAEQLNKDNIRRSEIGKELRKLQKDYDDETITIVEFTNKTRELKEELETLRRDNSFASFGVDEILTESTYTEALENLDTFREKLIETGTLRLLQSDDFIKAYEDETERENAAREAATNRVDNLIKIRTELIKSEQQYVGLKRDVFNLDNESAGLEERAKKAFLQNNKERIFDSIYTNAQILQSDTDLMFDKMELDKAYSDFYQFLLMKDVDITELSLEERKALFDDYVEYVKGKNKEASDEAKKGQEEQGYDLENFLRDFQQTAQLSVQVFQQTIENQLRFLEAEQGRLLDQIVGDSEEANEKRLEIEEEYEERRKELTKRNSIAQLQLSRIQATANVAEAVSKALAEGGFTLGAVFASIVAALGAVQVGVITQQIGQVRNLARGGLLSGLSHEYGGIPLAGGGVVAEGGEAVLNRRTSLDYRGLLNEVSISSGGAPIVSSSFDDERLIEAINRQNRNPIKAYVLEQDITRSQSINKRLQQLSKI